MAYNHWRNEAKVSSYLLDQRNNESSIHKEHADFYKDLVDETRKYLIKRIMQKETVNPKDLLDLIDGV